MTSKDAPPIGRKTLIAYAIKDQINPSQTTTEFPIVTIFEPSQARTTGYMEIPTGQQTADDLAAVILAQLLIDKTQS